LRTYLDHNATSPFRPSVKAATLAAMELCGNPSSVHAEGRLARKLIDDAREAIAFKIGCLPQMVTVTSGGTEANNMALHGIAAERILVSAIEHPSVLEAARATGKSVEIIPVDGQGLIDMAALEKMMDGYKALVSVMLANNETGVIQDIPAISAMVSKAGHVLHVDAVQSFGKMPVNFGLLGCDALSIAAHKVGGPKGVGALVIRDRLVVDPLIVGGGQELRRRSGTENTVAIAGFGAVAREVDLQIAPLADELREALEGCVIFSDATPKLANTFCFAVAGFRADTLLMKLDLEGVAVSSGSACSSGKVARSHVLDAMGVNPELAQGALRVSLGWNTTAQDIQHFSAVWRKIMARASAKAA
jgi:cysteine desulfurase